MFKYWPTFVQQWENSPKAAQKGLEIWKSARAAAAALKGHKIRGGNVNTKSILDASNRLAHTLALQGSPAMIMMPVKEATEKNVTVIPGGAGQETLENAAVLILAGMERNDRATTREGNNNLS
ncbi:disulfide bond formation protein DsbA [Salmonella enterica subsp. enterica]|nr:disulfide bond formation protein DsbA [Salmonella enterica subsp. enterica]EEA7994754.1 disulfide bond formation protein DsbA [Salmonella enterica subsp. enterica]